MEFSRISKYLYEIDISTSEKRELEERIVHVNNENENIKERILDYTA